MRGASRDRSRPDKQDRPGIALGGAHLAGLWAIAVAQPSFELLANGQVFVLFGWTPSDVLAYSLGLALVPPLALACLEALVRLSSARARWALHLLFVGGLVAVFAGYLIKQIDSTARDYVFLLAVLAGILAGFAYDRLTLARSFLSFLAAAPAVVLAMFLIASPVNALVFPVDRPETDSVDPNGTPVILIILDEFPALSLVGRDGEIDGRSYPGFASLAATSTWYPRATTVGDETVDAVPAIVTGKRPTEASAPSWRAHPDTIFNLLRDSEYRLRSDDIFEVCDPDVCASDTAPPSDGRFTRPLPALGKLAINSFAPLGLVRRLPDVTPLVSPMRTGFDEVAAQASAGAPYFAFLHASPPHSPWRFLPSGQQVLQTSSCCLQDFLPNIDEVQVQTGLPSLRSDLLADDQRLISLSKQAHLLQVGYADALVGDLLDDLRGSDSFDEAMVVVTSDHGAAFTAGTNGRRLTRENAPEIMGVPLFVKYPGQTRSKVDFAHVKNFDVLPTIAEELGMEIPWSIDALPLTSPDADRDSIRTWRHSQQDELEITADEFDARFDRLALREDVRFGRRQEGLQPFGYGPALAPRGESVRGAGEAERVAVVLDSPENYEQVDLDAETLPIQVSGQLAGRGAGEVESVAVALNGRIAATAWTYDSSGTRRFQVLVPPSALRSGDNDVQILRLARATGQLERLPRAR